MLWFGLEKRKRFLGNKGQAKIITALLVVAGAIRENNLITSSGTFSHSIYMNNVFWFC